MQQSQTIFSDPMRNRKSLPEIESLPQLVTQEEINNAPVEKTVSIEQTPEYAASKLDTLIDKSHTILFRAKTIFWFDPFQDEIAIDIHKINIVFKQFFLSQRIHSVMVNNITDVLVDRTPFSATIKIVDRGFTEHTVDVKNLSVGDALHARRIIQGLVVSREQGVDLTKLEGHKILDKLVELGRTKE